MNREDVLKQLSRPKSKLRSRRSFIVFTISLVVAVISYYFISFKSSLIVYLLILLGVIVLFIILPLVGYGDSQSLYSIAFVKALGISGTSNLENVKRNEGVQEKDIPPYAAQKDGDSYKHTDNGRQGNETFNSEARSPHPATNYGLGGLSTSWNSPAPYPSPTGMIQSQYIDRYISDSSYTSPPITSYSDRVLGNSSSSHHQQKPYFPSPIRETQSVSCVTGAVDKLIMYPKRDISTYVSQGILGDELVDNLRRFLGRVIRSALIRFDDVVERILVSLQNLGVPADQVSFARTLLRGHTVDSSASFHAASTGRPFHTLTELLVLCKRTRESSMAVPNSFLGPRPQGPPAFSDPARPGLDLLAEYEALAAMFRVQWGRQGDGQWSGTTTCVPADPKAVPTTSSFSATSPDQPLIQSRVIARLREIAADGYLSHLTWSSGTQSQSPLGQPLQAQAGKDGEQRTSDTDIVMSVFLNYCDSREDPVAFDSDRFSRRHFISEEYVSANPGQGHARAFLLRRKGESVPSPSMGHGVGVGVHESPSRYWGRALSPPTSRWSGSGGASTPHYNVVVCDPSPVEIVVPEGRQNVFHAMLVFMLEDYRLGRDRTRRGWGGEGAGAHGGVHSALVDLMMFVFDAYSAVELKSRLDRMATIK